MPGEDQERFEDYLELEHYIEELQAGRVAHPPVELTPEQARIYRMAALFRSASPEGNEPRPEFAAELRARLEQELQQQAQQQQPGRARLLPFMRRQKPTKPGAFSRRALLAGGAAIAASLVAGAAIDHVAEETTHPQTPAPAGAYNTPLVPASIATTWLFVTTLAGLGDKAVRFATDSIVGYVIRQDGDDGKEGQIIALSASCTHMGCIVQWQDSDRKFHCPCHGGLFNEYGNVDAGASSKLYLRPLPRLKTKVEQGNIYVKVPKPVR